MPPARRWLLSGFASVVFSNVLAFTGLGTGCILGGVLDPSVGALAAFAFTWLGLVVGWLLGLNAMGHDGVAGDLPFDRRGGLVFGRVGAYTLGRGSSRHLVELRQLDHIGTIDGMRFETPRWDGLGEDLLRLGGGLVSAAIGSWVLMLGLTLLTSGVDLEMVGFIWMLWMFQCVFIGVPAAGIGLERVLSLHGRRARTWTDWITVRGSVITTERGSFHVRGPVQVQVGEDRAGTWMELSDERQRLRFRAGRSDLLTLEQLIPGIRATEGDEQDVPEALRRVQAAREPQG